MVSSLGFLYGRRIYLNMVAGGFSNDLASLDDDAPHDRRYDRLVEYSRVVMQLLSSESPVSFDGEFYRIKNLKLRPPLASALLPRIVMSGSSEASLAAAEKLGALAVKYPKSAGEDENVTRGRMRCGIRIGIIARPTEDAAWRVALDRFPEDRKGQISHQLAMKSSDSVWHKQLSQFESDGSQRSPYWLGPFQNYKTFCPYLVGSYKVVAEEIARYIGLGYQTFILDIPPSEEELRSIGTVFNLARSKAA
jgi:alkanesulfonate monooxygenase